MTTNIEKLAQSVSELYRFGHGIDGMTEHKFFYELARYFDTCDAVISVTIPWLFNRGGKYEVTIGRDGEWIANVC